MDDDIPAIEPQETADIDAITTKYEADEYTELYPIIPQVLRQEFFYLH